MYIDIVGGAATMPHFTDADLMSRYGHQHSLHFTYYLKNARPSFATFAFIVANYRLESQKLMRRLLTCLQYVC